MLVTLSRFLQSLQMSPSTADSLSWACLLLGCLFIALMIKFVTKQYIQKIIKKIISARDVRVITLIEQYQVLSTASLLISFVFLYWALGNLVFPEVSYSEGFVKNALILIQALSVLVTASIVSKSLNVVKDVLSRLKSFQNKPLRTYTQIISFVIWFAAIISAISIILNKSPVVFLTGLGAFSAITMLVFKDSILGFVASIQVSAYDIVRVGDWITIASRGIDGDVIDVSINTVKVQNFDKTIVTLPTAELVTSSVQNWRGMSESGGRRIKRSLSIDLHSVKFCSPELLEKLSEIDDLKAYISKQSEEISEHNAKRVSNKGLRVNGRALTNLGLFRAYTERYLKKHPKICPNMTFLVRHLQPQPTGIPIEIYVFSNDTNWINYEAIQADIFDHLIAALPVFELKAFQYVAPAQVGS